MIKRFRVEYRPEALSDIDQLYFSIFSVSQDLLTADRFLARLFRRCESVGDAPNGGRKCGPPRLHLRFVPFERSAIILYRADGGIVEIIRIFPSRSDYHSALAKLPDAAS